MTPEEAQKIQELRGIYYQIYELNRKADLIFNSLQPKRKPKKFNKEDFHKEVDRIIQQKQLLHKHGI